MKREGKRCGGTVLDLRMLILVEWMQKKVPHPKNNEPKEF